MFRPYLTAGLLLLIYMGIGAGILALTLEFFPALAIFCILGIVIGFVPVMNSIAWRTFCFPGIGAPIAPHEIRQRLLAANDWHAPIVIQQTTPHTFAVTWRFREPNWWEELSQAGIHKLYTLQVKFDDARHEVVLVDQLRAIRWGTGPHDVDVGRPRFFGVLMDWEIGTQYSLPDNLMPGTHQDFAFAPAEIKTPVMNTILRSGWTVRMALW